MLKDRIADYSIWDTVGRDGKPVILYGTGNGGDKILRACAENGITVSAVFASSGFVRDREYAGMRVEAYEDIINKYGNEITVLAAFGTDRQEVIDFFYQLDKKHDFIIPDVPLYGGGLFDRRRYESLLPRLEALYERLEDKKSKDILSDSVNFRLTGKIEYLENTDDNGDVLRETVAPYKPEVVIDGGAFKGDSAAVMLNALPTLKKIIACEADPKTFNKLSAYAETTEGKVHPLCAALSDENKTIEYSSSSSRGSGAGGKNMRAKTVSVECRRLDDIITDKTDYIKLDVEGDEEKAIKGAEAIIKRDKPLLSVSLYHRTDDIVDLPETVLNLLPDAKLYLRRPKCIPMWDLTLYAVK